MRECALRNQYVLTSKISLQLHGASGVSESPHKGSQVRIADTHPRKNIQILANLEQKSYLTASHT